jgi:acetyl esterase/lipase
MSPVLEVQDVRICPGNGFVEHYDIAYASIPTANPNALSLDVYEPVREAGCPPAPVMIYVHGGGWAKGDKSAVGEKATVFAENGYVFVSTNYRMTSEVEFPVHAEDVARAIAWVYENAKDYGGDPNRLFLMGHSAGAHLVSLVATDERYLTNVGLDLRALSGVVANDTQAYDIAWLAEQQGGSLHSAYADTFGQDSGFWTICSPSSYVELNKGIPPMLLLVSRGMSPAYVNAQRLEAAAAFAGALREAGIAAEVLNAPDLTHSEINRQIGEPGNEITQVILEFLAAAALD